MGNGFPTAKFFRIINADTGLCLAAAHGGTTHGAQKAYDRLTGEVGFIPYSHTNDQVLTVRKPKHDRAEVWWFNDVPNTYGDPEWHLVNVNKDIRSSFALHVGSLDGTQAVELGLYGWGRTDQTQWKAGDGTFWPTTHDNMVATLLPADDGRYRAVLAPLGSSSNQQWRFEETELPGESVPVRRKGIYEPSGIEPGKWGEVI
ncbi:hypothetical protein [Nonomuraea sp. NPDC050786]|uniref:hypothetical protein n=1 Tax=Nonomuraea sp. NPDC050786 TaxID=3154840 RepID=UPI003408B3DA